jgi:hypothetical protein
LLATILMVIVLILMSPVGYTALEGLICLHSLRLSAMSGASFRKDAQREAAFRRQAANAAWTPKNTRKPRFFDFFEENAKYLLTGVGCHE